MRSDVTYNNTFFEVAKANEKYWQVKTYKIIDGKGVLINEGKLYKTKCAARKECDRQIKYAKQGFPF